MAFGPVAPGAYGAPNTGSTLGLNTGINKTSTALSTNILILVNNVAVGAVQSLQVQEQRSIRSIDEIGTDGHIDSAPQKSTDISGSCTRVRFDRLRITEAFGRGFIHIASQVYPFDIVVLDKQKRDQANQISTVIKNVWINNLNYTYNHSDWIISETMGWQAEAIFSFLNGGSAPAGLGAPQVAVGGERGIQHFGAGKNGIGTLLMGDNGNANNIEQLADTGSYGRRGSLDAAGLIDIGDSGPLLF
jgi:hypothetical protein